LVLILNRQDLEKLLSMKEVIHYVERAFVEYERGLADVPLRTIINVGKHRGSALYMPCYLQKSDVLAMKVVTVYERNLEKGLPTIFALVLLNDSETGRPLALLEGSYITAMRTGATSGVATKYLARKDSKIVGVVGAGTQAKTQLWAVCEVREIEKAFVYDVRKPQAENYAKEMSKKLGISVMVVNNVEELARQSDIIITATTAKEPVLHGRWVDLGVHINSIGWMGKDARELDSELVRRSKLVVDSREAVLKESGDILIPIREGIISEDHIFAELGEIVAGKKPSRIYEREITLFKSVGLAITDTITAKLAYEKALEAKIGVDVNL